MPPLKNGGGGQHPPEPLGDQGEEFVASAPPAGNEVPVLLDGQEFVASDLPAKAEPVILEGPFDVTKSRERTRGMLAGALFVLLAVTVLIVVVRGVYLVTTMQELTDLLGVLLAPLVGLVGAATGFYYGQAK